MVNEDKNYSIVIDNLRLVALFYYFVLDLYQLEFDAMDLIGTHHFAHYVDHNVIAIITTQSKLTALFPCHSSKNNEIIHIAQ